MSALILPGGVELPPGDHEPGVCIVCGCTEFSACDMGNGDACAWANAEQTLCTACLDPNDLEDHLDAADAAGDGPGLYIPFPSGAKEPS